MHGPTIFCVLNLVLLKQFLHAFHNATFLLFITTGFINIVFYRGAEEEEEDGSSWNINRAQWRATPSAHRQPLLFLFSFCFVCCIHHYSKKKTRNRAQHSTIHGNSLDSPPTSAVSTISHYSSSSPSPSFSASEQWRASPLIMAGPSPTQT